MPMGDRVDCVGLASGGRDWPRLETGCRGSSMRTRLLLSSTAQPLLLTPPAVKPLYQGNHWLFGCLVGWLAGCFAKHKGICPYSWCVPFISMLCSREGAWGCGVYVPSRSSLSLGAIPCALQLAELQVLAPGAVLCPVRCVCLVCPVCRLTQEVCVLGVCGRVY